MEQPELRKIGYGEAFMGFYALRNKEKRDYQGKCYLVFEFADSSGRFAGVYWGDDALSVYGELESASVVKIQAVMNEYKGRPQIKIIKIRPAREDEYDVSLLLPDADISREDLAESIQNIVDTVEDPFLGELLRYFFESGDFLSEFISAPAGKLWHGAYIGGLAEHTLNVAKICDTASNLFRLCRRDLIVCGALLHDIGKIRELSGEASFDYTIEGRLIGHIVLGERMITEAIRGIKDFPQELADEISHLILSHHGGTDMGSPVTPLTLEAAILHHADYMESQANAFTHVIEKEIDGAEPFSSWVKPAGRMLYLAPYRDSAEDTD